MFVSHALSTPFATAESPRGSAQERLIEALRSQVDERLGVLLPLVDAQANPVAAAMRYGVLAPGKRVRPLLMLLAARGFGLNPGDVLDAACALEMVHAASLFLDDMPCMDDAKLRRNQPTVHLAFGEDVAMLAAVALLASAWRITATAATIPPLVRADMVTVLSDAVGINGLVGGQYLDLHATGPARTTPQIAQTNQQKTGALFTAAFELAGLASGANEQTRAMMREAADALGQAFQLADDLADGEMDVSALGKDCQQDAGKATLVALVGPASTRRILAGHVRRAEALFAQAMPSDQALALLTRSLFAPQR